MENAMKLKQYAIEDYQSGRLNFFIMFATLGEHYAYKMCCDSIGVLAYLCATQLNAFADGSCEKHKDENGYYVDCDFDDIFTFLNISKRKKKKVVRELEQLDLACFVKPQKIYVSQDALDAAVKELPEY